MEVPTQYNEIGEVIPASATGDQIDHMVGEGRIQPPNDFIRLHRQASTDWRVNDLQAGPDLIDCETQ